MPVVLITCSPGKPSLRLKCLWITKLTGIFFFLLSCFYITLGWRLFIIKWFSSYYFSHSEYSSYTFIYISHPHCLYGSGCIHLFSFCYYYYFLLHYYCHYYSCYYFYYYHFFYHYRFCCYLYHNIIVAGDDRYFFYDYYRILHNIRINFTQITGSHISFKKNILHLPVAYYLLLTSFCPKLLSITHTFAYL